MTFREEIQQEIEWFRATLDTSKCVNNIMQRIEKLIDEKIKVIETLGDKYSFHHDSIIRTLNELKEQLKK